MVTELYIKERREERDVDCPIISQNCPVVNRLIAHSFPSLLKHMLPIITPQEIAARELKERLDGENISQSGDIKVYHITPCPAEMISIREPMIHLQR